MILKRLVILLLLFLIIWVYAGCGADGLNSNAQSWNVVLSQTDLEVNSSTINENDELRLVINSLSIYHSIKGQKYEIELSQAEKYGISDFSQYDDWYPFNTIDDMVTVFDNHNFQSYVNEHYGTNLISEYYLPRASVVDMYETETLDIDLLFINNQYYFNIIGSSFGADISSLIIWGVYDVQQKANVKTLAEFYAAIDGLEVKSVRQDSGLTVYYLFSKNGSVLFDDIGYRTNKPATAYLWEQNGVIGTIILPGEFSTNNLNLCILEKHEI